MDLQDIDAERRRSWVDWLSGEAHTEPSAPTIFPDNYRTSDRMLGCWGLNTVSIPSQALAEWATTLNTLAVALRDMEYCGLAGICADLVEEMGDYEDEA